MGHGLKMKAIVLVLCGALGVVLASECDIQAACDPMGTAGVEGGFENSDDVGSGSSDLMAGCTPDKTCSDMFVDCQDIDGKCLTGYPGCDVYGKTSCGRCLEACNAGTPYPPECKCRSCGFR
jgi:hypothetical protein